jgi:hypothetical protein
LGVGKELPKLLPRPHKFFGKRGIALTKHGHGTVEKIFKAPIALAI